MDESAKFDNVQLEFHPDRAEYELEQHQECNHQLSQCGQEFRHGGMEQPPQPDQQQLVEHPVGTQFQLEHHPQHGIFGCERSEVYGFFGLERREVHD